MPARGRRIAILLVLGAASVAALPAPSQADPCGMVPPIYLGPGTPIARIGDQNTFVFYKDGVETFIIHPAFKGKVDEFGMLIPFPAIPELRKVSDNIFPHVRAAIDPPEVVVYAYNRLRRQLFARRAAPASSAAGLAVEKKAEVRVVKEEAVGMYEVAVLEAGSAKALKKWMDDHGYKYPKGMDKACEDYVKIGWCFVAVKTKVSGKKGVDPRPGQRSVKIGLPKGASFDGHVQAMGFRFRSDKLVIPMRLSTFNEGDLHNIVYALTEEPMKIRSVPEEYVVRQISGEQLYKNVTQPLPLRIIGGTVKDLQPFQKKPLKAQRNPVPHNGAARDVFAADLLAVKTGQLSHPHEEKEKMLLRIGEKLGLRGPDIDKLNENSLAGEREKIVAKSLKDIKKMTLSVIDGNFPREVLANQNLTLAEYRMPARRNSAKFYDATTKKPAVRQQGLLIEGAVSFDGERQQQTGQGGEKQAAANDRGGKALAALLLLGLVGAVFVLRRKDRRSVAGGLGLLLAVLAAPSAVDAQDKKVNDRAILQLIDQLKDPKKASEASEKLIKIGQPAVKHLIGEAIEGSDLTMRGWSIVCLSEIGGKKAAERLLQMQNDPKQPMLVRTWAAAGRVHMADSMDELLKLAALINRFPALKRPIGIKLLAKLQEKGKAVSTEDLLQVTLRVGQLRQALAPAILNEGAEKLVKVMITSRNQNVRRMAAGYLATLAQQGNNEVASEVNEAYAFNAKAKKVPWDGGPLFVPGLRWKKDDAKLLVRNLLAWYVWIEENAKPPQRAAMQRPIHNNLNSIQLASAAGYQVNFRTRGVEGWLTLWGQAAGKKEVEEILKAQNLTDKPKYKKILSGLN